ncbi:hypothetical protein [Cytobacillus praedii]|uniref:hypothetical protein n=1 Tax=Cytobacillus praedii TaxID=1742358 RepID=UPI002E24615D|nr:hypothetical protein [Cytobacillus praedii]
MNASNNYVLAVLKDSRKTRSAFSEIAETMEVATVKVSAVSILFEKLPDISVQITNNECDIKC